MKYKSIIITVVVLVIACTAGYVAINQKKITDAKKSFVGNLEQITTDANTLESVPLQTIYRNGKDWFHVNAADANFKKGIYYTPEGYLGNGNSATFEEFSKSTHLSGEQAQALASIMEKYPYIEGITPDPNISSICEYVSNGSCRAIKFYMLPPAFGNGVSTDGFMYIPFIVSANGKDYMTKHFASITAISENWYQFSGEK